MSGYLSVIKYGVFLVMLFNHAMNSYALAPDELFRFIVLSLSSLCLVYCFYEKYKKKQNLKMFCFIFLALLPWGFYLQMYFISGEFVTSLAASAAYKAQCVVYNFFRYILLLTAALMLLESFFTELKKLIYS